jgi:GT2 family glycosyltransferase/glycosyltransferase involved in cell wall biosynthesis
VYRGLDETANCLYTAIRSRLIARTPIEVVAIDDCSPEPEVSELLDRLAGLRLLTVLRNDKNLGFVTTVNRGMALHDDRDVVLLNSDTEVYGDWIDRLHAAAFAAPLVGTVTPFSNNATICSYPYNCGDFRFQFERTFAEMDALAAEVNRGRIFDLPTGVGFCLYIRRECLDEVGLFDADAFGLGYGEENDFCCRIAERGWRNVLAADIFVRHLGRTSFGQTAWGELQQRARRILEQRYPDFFKSIGAFVARDPIQVLRRRLDVARLRGCADRAILMVSHNIGGGTEKHVRELCHCLERNGIGSYIWQPLNANQARIVHAKLRDVPNLGILDVKHGLADAARLFAELGVFHIHVHHLFGLSRDALHFFPALSREMGIRYDFTFHDYLPLCPRVHMTDRNGVFCGKGDLASCEICIPKLDSPFGDVSVAGWRGSYEPLLRGARRLFGPDEDLRRRVEALSPQLKLTVRPHPEPVPEARRQPLARRPGEELRVAVWGNLTLIKGAEQLQSCAADAFRRRLPIRFVVFGQCETELRYLPNVELVGRYRSQDLPGILAARPCHIALIPSVCPESYSFVLSEAFFAGLFPVAFDLGAQARRIREYGWGLLLPFAWIDEPGRINDALLACDIPPMPERPPVGGSGLYPDFLADYYQLEYDSVAATSGSEVPTLALVS